MPTEDARRIVRQHSSPEVELSRKLIQSEQGTCTCGRPFTDTAVYTYRSRTHVHRYFLCRCGSEWTETEAVFDLTEPVSSDEVIEVHTLLAASGGSFADMFQPKEEMNQ